MRKSPLHTELLLRLLRGPTSVSGDEGRMSHIVKVMAHLPECRSGAHQYLVKQMPDGTVLVIKGKPKFAILAHMDTVGFTAGYKRKLIDIGGPERKKGDELSDGKPARFLATIGKKTKKYKSDSDIPPGTILSFCNPPRIEDGFIKSAYLDNRIGMFIAFETLMHAPDVAVAFTVREETDQSGGLNAVRYLAEHINIRDYFVADITFATKNVKVGRGPVITGRDSTLPKQKLLNLAKGVAEIEDIQYQLELEEIGMSDAHGVLQSGTASGFCFIGVPIKGYHSWQEKASLQDIENCVELYMALSEKF